MYMPYNIVVQGHNNTTRSQCNNKNINHTCVQLQPLSQLIHYNYTYIHTSYKTVTFLQ